MATNQMIIQSGKLDKGYWNILYKKIQFQSLYFKMSHLIQCYLSLCEIYKQFLSDFLCTRENQLNIQLFNVYLAFSAKYFFTFCVLLFPV